MDSHGYFRHMEHVYTCMCAMSMTGVAMVEIEVTLRGVHSTRKSYQKRLRRKARLSAMRTPRRNPKIQRAFLGRYSYACASMDRRVD